jgi:hypothetical protein
MESEAYWVNRGWLGGLHHGNAEELGDISRDRDISITIIGNLVWYRAVHLHN